MTTRQQVIVPQALRPADKVAIVSPASKIDPALIDAAARQLRREGYEPVVMPHAKGECGSYSGTRFDRLTDLVEAICRPDIRAIVCSRGGYGAVHLLDELDGLDLRANAKWLVGFSDITALHALWGRHDVASIHGAMTKHLGRGEAFPSYGAEMALLQGRLEPVAFASHPLNRAGEGRGVVRGGNVAVWNGLISTPFDLIGPDTILLMEDIAEPIYKIERILYTLRLSGRLERLAGLIVGQFTDYRPSADWEAMEQMIAAIVAPYHFPVAFNAPLGHIPDNHPLLLNHPATLTVDSAGVTLAYTPEE